MRKFLNHSNTNGFPTALKYTPTLAFICINQRYRVLIAEVVMALK